MERPRTGKIWGKKNMMHRSRVEQHECERERESQIETKCGRRKRVRKLIHQMARSQAAR